MTVAQVFDHNEHKMKPLPPLRKPVKKKPKNKPKRPLSAYNFFFKEERAKIIRVISAENPDSVQSDPESEDYISKDHILKLKKDGGKISFEEMGKLIGTRWKNIDPDRLSKFSELATEDTERYKKEMVTYNNEQQAKARIEQEQPPYPPGPTRAYMEYPPHVMPAYPASYNMPEYSAYGGVPVGTMYGYMYMGNTQAQESIARGITPTTNQYDNGQYTTPMAGNGGVMYAPMSQPYNQGMSYGCVNTASVALGFHSHFIYFSHQGMPQGQEYEQGDGEPQPLDVATMQQRHSSAYAHNNNNSYNQQQWGQQH